HSALFPYTTLFRSWTWLADGGFDRGGRGKRGGELCRRLLCARAVRPRGLRVREIACIDRGVIAAQHVARIPLGRRDRCRLGGAGCDESRLGILFQGRQAEAAFGRKLLLR